MNSTWFFALYGMPVIVVAAAWGVVLLHERSFRRGRLHPGE